MFEPDIFGRKFTVLTNVHVTLLGIFGATRSHLSPSAVIRFPGNYAPLPPLVTPLQTTSGFGETCEQNGRRCCCKRKSYQNIFCFTN